MLCPLVYKKNLSKKMFHPKIGFKKILVQKDLEKKIWVQKYLIYLIYFKIFGNLKILDQKIFLFQLNFRSKKILNPKQFGPKIFGLEWFGSKKFFIKKIKVMGWSTQGWGGKPWKINSTPFLFPSGGLSSWRNLVTLSFPCCTLLFLNYWWMPRVSWPSLPWTRPGMCTLHFLRQFGATMRDKRGQGHLEPSIWCQTLFRRRSMGLLWNTANKSNNSCEIECIKNSNWLSFEIGRKLHFVQYKQP